MDLNIHTGSLGLIMFAFGFMFIFVTLLFIKDAALFHYTTSKAAMVTEKFLKKLELDDESGCFEKTDPEKDADTTGHAPEPQN